MNPNPDIYPSVYGATLTAENDRVEWSYPISHLNFLDKLPFEQPMDGSNSYIGFDPTINNCYVGAAKHTVMRINPEDKKQAVIENTTYKKKINYRLLMMDYTSQLSNIPIKATYPVAWTNIVSPWFSKFQENAQSIQYYNVIAESTGTAVIPSAALTSFNAYKSYIYSPITKINTDAIVIIPEIQYRTYNPRYDGDGNIISASGYVSWLNYYQIKPEDKTPAGQYYDNDLWEKGYKDTIDAETGRITQRVVIGGVRINGVYYGVNARNPFGSLPNTTWSDKNLRQSATRFDLNILAEYYDEDRKAIIYEYPNGVFFSSNSGEISPPVTPWSQFFDNTLVSYTRMNPNDCGYSSSSADNSGLTCNNDTNDLVSSNIVVLPSNFVSAEEDINRFEIHNGQSYYYFNSDGTISSHSTYVSSNRQYYSYGITSSCFPLKDLIATVASFGLFFMDGSTSGISYVLDDPTTYDSHLYRGKFDENGVSDGTWWQGDDIPEDKLEDIDYEPEVPGGGGGDDDEPTTSGGDDHLPRRGFSIGGTGGFVTQYALSYSQLHEFANMLWAQFGDEDFISNIGTTFLNDYSIKPSDILNYIVSMRVYPFNLADSVSYTDTQSNNIFIGRGVFPYILTTGNTHVIGDTCETFDGGYCDVPHYYNDFRDYEPASSIEVYVPYCGSVSVAPSEVVGKRLRLTYGVDYSTGALSATLWVISDTNYTLAVLSGQVAASIQMSASNEMDGILRLTSIATTIGKAMLADDKVNASKLSDSAKNVAKASNVLGTTSELVNTVSSGLPTHSIGNTNGFSNFATPPRACITISYRKYKNPQNFAHVYGYKCNRRETLGDLDGYTKCKNVDVSGFTCHEDERAEIKALLESGVYL